MSRPGGPQRAGASSPSDSRGVTLIELLVAMAIGSMLLIAVAGLLSSTRAGESALSRSVEPSQALQLAAELLREELGMAGFIPFPPGSTPTLATGTARVRVKDNGGGAGHSLGIGFIDDRLASGPVLRDLSFSTGVDGRGDAQLYRRAASGTRQPLVEGIASLRLAAFVDDAGVHPLGQLVAGTPSTAVWALLLELSAPTSETMTLLVELPSRPSLMVEP